MAQKYPMNSETGEELTCRQAGRLGGLETLRRRGRAHFSECGRLGQQALKERWSTEDRRQWGRLGGRPRRVRYKDMGERELGIKEGGSPPVSYPTPPPEINQEATTQA